MKKSLFLIALASMAVVGCSKDEITEINPDNAIKFTATAAKATRATPTTTESINTKGSQFHVWAFASGQSDIKFMNDLATCDGQYWNYATNKYWPNTGTVDFYAVHPTSLATLATVNATTQNIANFTVDQDVTKQIDFIYALNLDEKKQTTAVPMNFRHALSQIVFAAESGTNSNIEVQINAVSVHNIKESGNYTFPELETTKQLETDTGAETEDSNEDGIKDTYGEWHLDDKLNYFAAGITNRTINPGQTATLTKSTDKVEDNPDTEVDETTAATTEDALLLLPQEAKAWDPNTEYIGSTAVTGKDKTQGAYFKISCKVLDATTDVYLYGNATSYDDVYVPVDIDWEQGKKYIYTFVFDNGAGYNPEGDPVLVPIKFTVTVDEFQSANEIEIEM